MRIIMSGKLPCPPPQSAPKGPPGAAEPGACVEPEPAGAAADGGGAAVVGAAEGGAADGGGAACRRSVEIMGWACTARGPFRQLNLEIASAAKAAYRPSSMAWRARVTSSR